jgi:hypothetical protein
MEHPALEAGEDISNPPGGALGPLPGVSDNVILVDKDVR